MTTTDLPAPGFRSGVEGVPVDLSPSLTAQEAGK